MKKIILCADDYGQSRSISTGILQLVQAGRLSAVSCMSEGKEWHGTGHMLREFKDRIDIGLHFNLTHPFPQSTAATLPLQMVLAKALSGRIDQNAVARALNLQLDAFEKIIGKHPDFVDGHQHVHVFPGIRNVVIDCLRSRFAGEKPYLRAVNPSLMAPGGLLKLGFLKLLGSGFSRAAARHGILTNARFAGIYPLQTESDFPNLMRAWIEKARSGDLLMCHPGCPASDDTDPSAPTRPLELRYLSSPEFGLLLSEAGIRLSRMTELQ